MHRGVTKTYSRSYGRGTVKDLNTTTEFDDAFNDNSNVRPMAARGRLHKWGKTSFTSSRLGKPFEEDEFLVKREKKPSDPFNFDTEESHTKSPRKVTRSAIKTPALASVHPSKQGFNENNEESGDLLLSDTDKSVIKTLVEAIIPEEEPPVPVVEEPPSVTNVPFKTYTRHHKYIVVPDCDSDASLIKTEDSDRAVDSSGPISPTKTSDGVYASSSSMSSPTILTPVFSRPDSPEQLEMEAEYDGEQTRTGSGRGRSGKKLYCDVFDIDEVAAFRFASIKAYGGRTKKKDPSEQSNTYRLTKTVQSAVYTPKTKESFTVVRVSPPCWFKPSPPTETQPGSQDEQSQDQDGTPMEPPAKKTRVSRRTAKSKAQESSQESESTEQSSQQSTTDSEDPLPVKKKGSQKRLKRFFKSHNPPGEVDVKEEEEKMELGETPVSTSPGAAVSGADGKHEVYVDVADEPPDLSHDFHPSIDPSESDDPTGPPTLFLEGTESSAGETDTANDDDVPQWKKNTRTYTRTKKTDRSAAVKTDKAGKSSLFNKAAGNIDLQGSSQPDSISLPSGGNINLFEDADNEQIGDNGILDGGPGMSLEDDRMSSGSKCSTPPLDDGTETQTEKKIFKSKNGGPVGRILVERNKLSSSPKKSPAKATYNARTWNDDEESPAPDLPSANGKTYTKPQKPVKKTSAPPKFEEDAAAPLPKVKRTVIWGKRQGDEAYTSLHVSKQHKELFTVVHNVKDATEVQESGETQEFMDDIEYLLHGLDDTEPVSTRCLSCIGLATKCTLPGFRMHMRAHGIDVAVFSALHDAYTHPHLAFCTATLMFMLSRDRHMELNHNDLDLMLKLFGVEGQDTTPTKLTSGQNGDFARTRQRVRELLERMSKEAGVQSIDLDRISTANLGMESLLSLTSRKAGEAFKEELRSSGALDHIVDSVCTCVRSLSDEDADVLSDQTVENLRQADRCLRVMENITFLNYENQSYLIACKDGELVSLLCSGLSVCQRCLRDSPVDALEDTLDVDKECTGWAIFSCVLAVLRVLLNITHDNEWGSTKVGNQEGLLNSLLSCVLTTPQYVPIDQRFDILVLSIGLLINLTEHCDINRRLLISMQTRGSFTLPSARSNVGAMQALVELFFQKEKAAKHAEAEASTSSSEDPNTQSSTTTSTSSAATNAHNKSGMWKESDTSIMWVMNSTMQSKDGDMSQIVERPAPPLAQSAPATDDDDEKFTQALHKAGKHMEDSIVAAYIALLIGCVIQDNQEYIGCVKDLIPDGDFEPMIKMLKKFLGFMNLTTAAGGSGGKSISRVIEILETC